MVAKRSFRRNMNRSKRLRSKKRVSKRKPRNSKTRKSLFRKNRISLRKSVVKNLSGGSPASSHVINLLPASCEPLKMDPMTPPSNADVSNSKLWITTGGARKKRRKSKRKKN